MAKSRARSAAVIASASVALCAAYACTVTDGLRLPARNGPDAAEAPEATDNDGDAEAGGGCAPERIPPPPESDVDGADVEYLFAVRDISFSFDESMGNVGFDLDQACTCYPDKDTCRVASPEPHCDGEHGRDNAVATLAQTVAFPPELDVQAWVKQQLAKGKTGLLVKVSGYNGQPDDRIVQVSFYPSAGIEQAVDGGTDPPTWTKADRWKIDPSRLLGDPALMISTAISPKAYVTKGRLVANFASSFPLAGLDITIESGAFVADLRATDPPSLEHGVIVGRWDLNAAVKALGQMTVGKKKACELDFFPGLASRVCGLADIRVLPTDDGANYPCNALSVGIGFVATEATFGGFQKIPIPTPCEDAGVVACN